MTLVIEDTSEDNNQRPCCHTSSSSCFDSLLFTFLYCFVTFCDAVWKLSWFGDNLCDFALWMLQPNCQIVKLATLGGEILNIWVDIDLCDSTDIWLHNMQCISIRRVLQYGRFVMFFLISEWGKNKTSCCDKLLEEHVRGRRWVFSVFYSSPHFPLFCRLSQYFLRSILLYGDLNHDHSPQSGFDWPRTNCFSCKSSAQRVAYC